ncbi:ribosomal L7Ae/L30e/S12e/Gadd45 family protein [Fusibacter sp. JL216-2]|uniref:ribosomal L7Ae/L30e/S12e/Gadd45 family protein n=1 Tax=Fusibacter sp. JL216-2 TaxID=3071453 RepID=UPI003D33D5A1
MPVQELQILDRDHLKIGVKQSSRAITEGRALKVFVARNAEQHVTRHIIELAEAADIEIEYVENMRVLGLACKIDVGAATAVITK